MPDTPMSTEERHAISALTQTVTRLETSLSGMAKSHDNLAAATRESIEANRQETRELAKSFTESRQFGWGKAISMIGGLVVLFGVAGTMIGQKTENTLAPLVTRVQLGEAERAQSRNEIGAINAHLATGKEQRKEFEAEMRVTNAVQNERIAQMYFALHGHYPPAAPGGR